MDDLSADREPHPWIGATYTDKVYLNNTNLAFVPSAFAVDAMASYRIGQWLLQINATNLFDELNYAGSQNGRAVPSPGRTFIFSIGTTF